MKHSTLTKYLHHMEHQYTHSLHKCIHAMASSARDIRKNIITAPIEGLYGATGAVNIQGEAVQHLDSIADTHCIRNLEHSGVICGVVSEEHEEAIIFPSNISAPYVAIIDPLDGSSNIDTNNTIGTIFCIFERITPHNESPSNVDFLQTGTSCLCAGYIAYGPTTMFVFSIGSGLHIYAYDPNCDDFVCIENAQRIPHEGKSYAINEGYFHAFNTSTQRYINEIKSQSSHSLRYVGSLIADIHRILLQGGIFIYPTLHIDGKEKNKLRLLCECIPIAFLIEQAGGYATNGKIPIRDIRPQALHQRSALYCGSPKEMEAYNLICMHTHST